MYVLRMQVYLFFFLILGIGKLIVLMKENNRVTEIWRKTGNQGRNWQKATIDIGRVDGAFQVGTFSAEIHELTLVNSCKLHYIKQNITIHHFTKNHARVKKVKHLFLFSTLSF